MWLIGLVSGQELQILMHPAIWREAIVAASASAAASAPQGDLAVRGQCSAQPGVTEGLHPLLRLLGRRRRLRQH